MFQNRHIFPTAKHIDHISPSSAPQATLWWRSFVLSSLALAMCVLLSGCTGPAINPHARTTFLSSRDLVNMTNKMAASITSNPHVARITTQGPMIIVLTPLKNNTNQIITRGQGDAFLDRLRTLLVSHQSLRQRFVFVVNPRVFHRLQRRYGSSEDLGINPSSVQPQYALQAVFYADTKVAARYRSDYYLCTFFLTKITTGIIVWEGSYETKIATHGGFLY
jgi:PBP1b-binding outer membrane lipoprotein LpoB